VNRREFLGLAAIAPLGLRASLQAPSVHALVTCDSQSRLAVVDVSSFRVVDSIATLPDPRAIELVGRRAVVCHTAVGAVSVVEGGRMTHVVRGFVEPRYVAAHPDGRHAFVTDSGRSGVSVVDLVHGRVIGRVGLSGWARHITIDPHTGRLWVGLGSADPRVAVVAIDGLRLRHTSTLEPGFRTHDVGSAPDGTLWITSGDAGTLAVGRVRLEADAAPQHVTFGAGRAYVTSGDAGTFHVQGLDGELIRRTRIPTGSYNVQYGYGRVITPSLGAGTLAILDRRGASLAVVHVADSCHDACFAPS
jgi:DNA-binding beta-propeller fold protein YncE